jgi:hypothetical protein
MIRDLRHPRAIRMAAQARAGRISDERGMRRLLPSSGPGSAVIRSCVSSRATGSTVAARASSPGRISSAPCSGTSLTRRVRTRPTSPAQCSFRRPGGFKPRASALIEKASRDVARAARSQRRHRDSATPPFATKRGTPAGARSMRRYRNSAAPPFAKNPGTSPAAHRPQRYRDSATPAFAADPAPLPEPARRTRARPRHCQRRGDERSAQNGRAHQRRFTEANGRETS